MFPAQDITQFLDLVYKNGIYNQRANAKDPSFYFEGLKDEVEEVAEELTTGDPELIMFELVDVFWTAFNLVRKLDHEGIIDKSDLFQIAYQKYAERLPNIVKERFESKERQDDQRNKAKKEQKKKLGLA